MKYQNILFVLCMIVTLSFTSAHKYYLSLTQIEYNTKSKSVQIIINVFMDDIEMALNKDYNIDLQLTTKKELRDNDVYFREYLEKVLQFKIDKFVKKYTYVGKEYEDDLVYFYLEIENIESVKIIEVTNKILMNHFPTQQNLIKSKVKEKYKSVLLDVDKSTGILEF